MGVRRRIPGGRPHVLELGEAPAEIGCELVRALLPGHDGQHLFQVFELFAHRPGLPAALLNCEVPGREVGRQGPS
jgi:hypothetical protein